MVPKSLSRRSWGEWSITSHEPYPNPFADVDVEGQFTSPGGQVFTLPAFYDGDHTWRVRFNPPEAGQWTYRIGSQPHDPALTEEGSFEVTPNDTTGFLKATPGKGWGFSTEAGDPVFLFSDTVYELFGMAHCGVDVLPFLKLRHEQGFNLLRVRMQVSPYVSVGEPPVPPEDYQGWHNRSTWPWGGAEQYPRFDHFNLDYFHTVDRVMRQAEEVGIGLELIMEAWGNEFPFNNRVVFTPEWEQFWMRYLIARYDAFPNVYVWTLFNEYEYYPDGTWPYKPVADRWAMRVGRWVKSVAQHGHIVAVHNGPREPAFAQRFKLDPEAIDLIMYQEWGTRDERDGWLAAGIEEQTARSMAGWRGSAMAVEWGYERNPDMPNLAPHHSWCDADHTRRGAWRNGFIGLCFGNGFENSWGIFPLNLDDQPGMPYLLLARKFFAEVVPFHRLRPAPHLIKDGKQGFGHQPHALATPEMDIVAVYLPTGGHVKLDLPSRSYQAQWFDPRTGVMTPASTDGKQFESPGGGEDRPWDWVLLLRG